MLYLYIFTVLFSLASVYVNFKYIEKHDKKPFIILSFVPLSNLLISYLVITKEGNSFHLYQQRKRDGELDYYEYLNEYSPRYYKILEKLKNLKESEIKRRYSPVGRGNSYTWLNFRGFELSLSMDYISLSFKGEKLNLSEIDLNGIRDFVCKESDRKNKERIIKNENKRKITLAEINNTTPLIN